MLVLYALFFCSPLAGANAGHSAYYQGPISAQHNREFFQVIADRKIKRLHITSSGGEVDAGVDLGRWVYENQIDVVVEKYCLSSCANYVFTAGRHKTIKPQSVVAWHGNYHHLQQTGLWRDDISVRMQRKNESRAQASHNVSAQLKRLVEIEKAFFQHIGVNEYLCWVGKQPPFNAPDYYFMSAKDMAVFGIDNVHHADDYADTDLSHLDMSVMFIRLSDRNK